MDEIILAAKLSELRRAKGITQEQVASSLNVSNKTISKWENGSSTPELSMLAALAKYYGVTTDTLLGLEDGTRDTKRVIMDEFAGLDRRQAALKIFDILEAIYPAYTENANCTNKGFVDLVPHTSDKVNRSHICEPEMYSFKIASPDLNIAVTQFCNKSNFSWLLDGKKREKITDLMKFLADDDALRILYLIHSTSCSENFTAEYISKNASVSLARTTKILEKCCDIDICSKVTAHLKEGEVTIYNSFGDGLILAMISIAYERMFGRAGYEFSIKNNVKMIGGAHK